MSLYGRTEEAFVLGLSLGLQSLRRLERLRTTEAEKLIHFVSNDLEVVLHRQLHNLLPLLLNSHIAHASAVTDALVPNTANRCLGVSDSKDTAGPSFLRRCLLRV